MSGAGLAAATEAIKVGRAFGLDPNVMVDVLNASTGRNNSTEVKLKQFIISESYDSGFFIGLMAKDIRIADVLAKELGIEAPLADKTADLWDQAVEQLGAMGCPLPGGVSPVTGSGAYRPRCKTCRRRRWSCSGTRYR